MVKILPGYITMVTYCMLLKCMMKASPIITGIFLSMSLHLNIMLD